MSYVASKFNPDTDPDRPEVGSMVRQDGENYEIEKFDWLSASIVIGGFEPDKGEYDLVLLRQHAERPAVFWVIWLTKET